jgi:hypothetical protein
MLVAQDPISVSVARAFPMDGFDYANTRAD